ncbi:TPA: collagen-like repeat preface domain-containing protein, partial [Bacillus cereus]|nr:collagen-like repeat preface domain-containing protein [Bacillus cereus]
TGLTGPTGLTGATGAGAVIPFASGGPVALATVLGGLANTGALLGFGSSFFPVIVPPGGPITIGPVPPVFDFAFVAPRAGTITSLAGFFSVTVAVALSIGSIQIQMQLYSAPAASNTFTPVGTPLLLTPAFSGLIAIGNTSSGISAQAIAVAPQDKILLVVSSTTPGFDIATAITGFASAGITFV